MYTAKEYTRELQFRFEQFLCVIVSNSICCKRKTYECFEYSSAFLPLFLQSCIGTEKANTTLFLSGHYRFKHLSEGEHIFLARRLRHVDSRNYSPTSTTTISGVAIENKGDVLIVERGRREGLLFLTNNSRSRTWNMFPSRKLGRFSLPTQLVFTAVPRSVIVVRALCRALMVFHLRIARRLLNNAAAILKQLDKK